MLIEATANDKLQSGLALGDLIDDSELTVIYECSDGTVVKFFNYDDDDTDNVHGVPKRFLHELEIMRAIGAVTIKADHKYVTKYKSLCGVTIDTDIHANVPRYIPNPEYDGAICPRVLEVGYIGPVPYFRMENAGTEIEDDDFCDVDIMQKICKTVELLHKRGVVHCDIKPANILINAAEDIKIIDYDSACLTNEACPFKSIGTYPYLAPEITCSAQGKTMTPAVDYFALGLCVLEASCEKQFTATFGINEDAKMRDKKLERKLTQKNLTAFIYRYVTPALRGFCKFSLRVNPQDRKFVI